MRILGLDVTRRRRDPVVTKAASPITADRGFWQVVFDAWPGAWQSADPSATYTSDTVLAVIAIG